MVVLCQHYIAHAYMRLSGSSMRSYGVPTSAEYGEILPKYICSSLKFFRIIYK